MKILRRVLFGILAALALVVAGFFADRYFVSYYKVEAVSREAELAEKFADAVFRSRAPVPLSQMRAMTGDLCGFAEDAARRAVGVKLSEKFADRSMLAELLRLCARDMSAKFPREMEVSSGSVFAKSADTGHFSERGYQRRVLAVFKSAGEGSRFYADIGAEFAAAYDPVSGKIDFPMSLCGKSLWRACGFSDDGKTLSLSPKMAEELKRVLASAD